MNSIETTTWGKELTPGPFAVGFRTAWATDYSRFYGPVVAETDARRDNEPKHATPSSRPFRPVFIALWYPAATPGTDETTGNLAPPLTYGDYLNVTAEDPAFAPMAQRLTAYLRDTTLRYGLAIKPEGLDDTGRAELAHWERFPLRALRDAAPVVGQRFPVVFYHPGLGGSYEDNGVLCEYLASHGYLVVSSGFQKEDAASLHVNWDLNRSINDLSFLMNFLATDPQADMTRIGAVGQSYGGQALMAWSSETNAPVRAVVSLDSTVDYAALDAEGFAPLRKRLERVSNVQAAWLLFAVAERNPNWGQWDSLTHTPRWFAETGPLGHNDFTAQGLIGTLRRHEDLEEARRIRSRYDAICELTRDFLDAYVKNAAEAKPALEQWSLSQRNGLGTQEMQIETPSPEMVLTLKYEPPTFATTTE